MDFHRNYVPFPSTLPAGHRLRQYRVERAIADGSDTIVYSTRCGRALKEFFPHSKTLLQPTTTYRDLGGYIRTKEPSMFKMVQRRFEFGAEFFQHLNHPILMKIEDIFRAHGTSYVIGEYIRGLNCFAYQEQNKLPLTYWQGVFQQVMECLSEFHRLNHIQGDITSSNVLIDSEGRPKIVDFGSIRPIGVEYNERSDYLRTARLISNFTELSRQNLESNPKEFIMEFFKLQ